MRLRETLKSIRDNIIHIQVRVQQLFATNGLWHTQTFGTTPTVLKCKLNDDESRVKKRRLTQTSRGLSY
jgi:hypothetical protein